jgi:glycosyltransferase involved in cell wall biosynthesis
MQHRVLFISIDGMTDPLGQSQVIPYLAGLARQGYQVTIISCEKKDKFKAGEKIIKDQLALAGIGWQHCFYSKKIPLLSQRGNLYRLKKLAIAYAKKNRGKFIAHCRSYLPALIGLHLKKKYHARFVFDMRGFWADERVEGGIWKLSNPVHKSAYRYFKRKEKELILNADHIVTLTHAARKILHGWFPQKKLKITVIPCCSDLEHFTLKDASQRHATRKKLHLPLSGFVIGYLGSIGTWYMLDEMLDLFKELLKEKPGSCFFFITQDDPESILRAAAKRKIPEGNLLIKAATRAEVPHFISALSAGLFFIRPSFSKQGSSPTKMAELLACGLPVITNAGVGDCDKVILENKAGIVIKDLSAEGYHASLAQLDACLLKEPAFYRQVARDHFSLESGIALYKAVYTQFSK